MNSPKLGLWKAEQEILSLYFGGISIEVGCYQGWTTRFLAPLCAELICIDPWDGQQDGANDEVYNDFCANTKEFSNLRVIRDRSQDVDLEEYRGKIAAVLIDGLHTYEGCLADIRKFEGLLYPGGHIFVHDVFDKGWPGVKQAVDDYLKETGRAASFFSYYPTPEEAKEYGHGVSGLAFWKV